ncbi:hypothetical protein NEOLEDRAFT_1148021 [Neolentinus lepideus HHB14362 ss-1]|uniref:DNA breaking-rejoining enzyme n=1 Tax=Neolentinus lepideus HHB14362 ss-1 TaxID=1314782 RepID=A0A165SME0_9AGAM|nr:hypothetical protein NEOLEDRAFT_1148021 [Neolentinus lepideus HHB14362 ss-1]
MFNSLHASAPYNNILRAAVDILLDSGINLRVHHIPGEENVIADALSRFQNHTATAVLPSLKVSVFQPPRWPLGATKKMIPVAGPSRQPTREPWTLERLVHERAIALGSALSESSHSSYSSALKSYLAFCKSHCRPVEPTEDTLSFYIVYMCRHINPSSVQSYLSGICSQLEPYYPLIRQTRNSPLVSKTLTGCKKLYGKPVARKAPLSISDLHKVVCAYESSDNLEDLLFLTQLLCGFFGLMRLSELCWPDKKSLQDWRRVVLRHTVTWYDGGFTFLLPGHKADSFWEGNKIMFQKRNDAVDPIQAIGRWKSDAFKVYIRKNPVLLHALVLGRSLAPATGPGPT